ncbi:hypothetical protein BB559_004216 [Furculomyces boomerangus]|uniref:DNA damage-binding protein CMR1 n=1 Tax=Furculomyces boomerangus TaxID=61424 RepID=A0A2T9YFV4_9FUNG|nr:hypothetical protein BB559_004216 [Furculomyces boomerangus]
MNTYEKQRLENIKKNQEMLLTLGLKATDSTPNEMPSFSSKKREPMRKSLRIRGIKPTKVENPNNLPEDLYTIDYETSRKEKRVPVPYGEIVSLENGQESKDIVKYFKLVAKQFSISVPENNNDDSENKSVSKNSEMEEIKEEFSETSRIKTKLEIDENSTLSKIFKNMKIRHYEANIPITTQRIYSIAFHPNPDTDSILVCAGDKRGTLGFWRLHSSDYIVKDWESIVDGKKHIKTESNPDNKESPKSSKTKNNKIDSSEGHEPDLFSFYPHSETVSCINIPQESPNNVYTSGYDGTIRILDLSHPTSFNQILKLKDDPMITSMELQFYNGKHNSSHPLVWFTTTSGIAGFTDPREPNSKVHSHMFHDNRIGCISTNPKVQNILATASTDRTIRVWDVRHMLSPLDIENETESNPIELQNLDEGGSVTSAYFNPSGDQLATTSFNNIVSVWSFDKAQNKVVDKKFLNHNNRTGRWLSMFRSRWHPNPKFPSCFVVGNMNHSVDIYSGRSMEQISNLKDGSRIKTVPAVNIFHPHLAMIASGNASGKISIWS